MGIAAILDKAGPTLATGIVLAFLGAAATSALAWRDLLSTSSVRFSVVTAELERLRGDLENFRAPGGRFTAHDGDRHWQRMDDLDRRIREQETRAPRLNPALDAVKDEVDDLEHRVTILEERVKMIASEQDRLCQRMQSCGRR